MEEKEERLPKRKSPRANWLEYNDGMYFITVCTHERKHFLGEINNDVMTMTITGNFLLNELANATTRHPHITIEKYVVMPNHFHAIVRIVGTQRAASAIGQEWPERNNEHTDNEDAARSVPTRTVRKDRCKKDTPRPALSTFIGSIKAAVTKYAHECGFEFAWQPRYHDHAIRGISEANNIAMYIDGNIANWGKDCYF